VVESLCRDRAALLSDEQLESLNCARNFFSDGAKRWNNRLILESSSRIEEYRRGRLAIILHCQMPSLVRSTKIKAVGLGQVQCDGVRDLFIVLKAHIPEFHPLNYWDEMLVFIPVIKVMQGVEGIIPTRVGFYVFQNKLTDSNGNLLLFQSLFQPGYKFLPTIADWEQRPLSGAYTTGSEAEQIERTPQIMERISNYQCATVARKFRKIDIDTDVISAFSIALNAKTVEARIQEGYEHRIKIINVLLGPLNL